MPLKAYSTEIIGPGEPIATVYVGVHGDETAPARGVHRMLNGLPEGSFLRAFRLVVCNLRAAASRRRFVDCDLNRAFPGNPHSPLHEERLAHALLTELTATEVNIDVHSTSFPVSAYGIVHSDAPEDIGRLPVTPLRNYVRVTEPSLISCLPGAQAFEVGRDDDPQSEMMAGRIVGEVLRSVGCLPSREPAGVTDIRVHRIVGVLRKSNFSEVSPGLRDFELVHQGQALGTARDGTTAVAERPFVPIWVNDPVAIRIAAAPTCYSWQGGLLTRAGSGHG